MNKTAIKIFIDFVLTAALISTILLAINFSGFALIGSDSPIRFQNHSARGMLRDISNSLKRTESGFELTNDISIPDNCWCILLDENGNIVWSENKPEDIPEQYSINDIAKMTRWFLNDYPVYVSAEDYGLLVFGIPKNAVGKYDIEYSMSWFNTLPQRVIAIFLLNVILAAILACVIGMSLYKRICTLMRGIDDLRQEKRVHLKESGLFKELARNINITSDTIERKNTVLLSRDSARSNWISGISHDIRTPLSIIMGYSEKLESSEEIPGHLRNQASIIKSQSIKLKKLIEDLNIISSLEYDMQPAKKAVIKICPLLRRVVSDIINSGISESFGIILETNDERAKINADESLIERAIFNLINNSITHNPGGCSIFIKQNSDNGRVLIEISDNGSGVPEDVLNNIEEIPKSAHGLGLPMAYRIIRVHGGSFSAFNYNGFHIKIALPLVE